MLTLTLRSSTDGRFLARIVEQQGTVFVLDYGDRRVIDDATQRINKGFTVFRAGKLVRATPRDPDLMLFLGDYYAGEGFLVFLEEPRWSKRAQNREEVRPEPLRPIVVPEDDSLDSVTDILSKEDAHRVRAMVDERRARREEWKPSRLDENAPTLLNLPHLDVDELEDSDTEVMMSRLPGIDFDDGDT